MKSSQPSHTATSQIETQRLRLGDAGTCALSFVKGETAVAICSAHVSWAFARVFAAIDADGTSAVSKDRAPVGCGRLARMGPFNSCFLARSACARDARTTLCPRSFFNPLVDDAVWVSPTLSS